MDKYSTKENKIRREYHKNELKRLVGQLKPQGVELQRLYKLGVKRGLPSVREKMIKTLIETSILAKRISEAARDGEKVCKQLESQKAKARAKKPAR